MIYIHRVKDFRIRMLRFNYLIILFIYVRLTSLTIR